MPVDAPHRSYRDPWHKPELIYALTRFEGMAGFRDVGRSCALLEAARPPLGRRDRRRLTSDFPRQTLRAVVSDILTMPSPSVAPRSWPAWSPAARAAAERGTAASAPAVRAAAAATPRRPSSAARRSVSSSCSRPSPSATRTTPGVLVTLLLNHVVLAPGEAMFVGGRRRARLRLRLRRRDHGRQRQRAPSRPDPEAPRRARAAGRHGLHPAAATARGPCGPRRSRLVGGTDSWLTRTPS